MSVITQQSWNAFVTASPQASFLQSWGWGEMQHSLKVPFWRLVIGESEHPQGVALVLRRELPLGRSWLYVPRGPIFASETPSNSAWQQLHGQLSELAEQQHALFIRVEPAWP